MEFIFQALRSKDHRRLAPWQIDHKERLFHRALTIALLAVVLWMTSAVCVKQQEIVSPYTISVRQKLVETIKDWIGDGANSPAVSLASWFTMVLANRRLHRC
ncbi:MAG: hypothetical protein ABSE51_21100 [Terracidiphilus sp.]